MTARRPRGPARHRGSSVRLVVLAALAGLLPACGSDDSPTAAPASKPSFSAGSTMSRLAQAGTVRVAVWFDMPPFGERDGAEPPTGFDVEIAQIIAAKLGVPARQITWVQAHDATRARIVARGEADLVIATLSMDSASEQLDLAGPYYVTEQRLLVPAEAAELGAKSPPGGSYPGSVCAVLDLPEMPAIDSRNPAARTSGASAEIGLRADQVVHGQALSVCLDRLRSGEVAAVAGPAPTLQALVAASDGALAVLPGPLGPLRLGVGIGAGDTGFCAFIAETLAEASSSGSYLKAWTRSAGLLTDQPEPSLPTAEPCR